VDFSDDLRDARSFFGIFQGDIERTEGLWG